MSKKKSPYELLGIEVNASNKEIKKSRRILMSKYHPDKVINMLREQGILGTPEGDKNFKEMEEKASEINAAYEILENEESKSVYDKYGYDGLEALQNGDDPAQSGGVYDSGNAFDNAASAFSNPRETEEELSDEELFGEIEESTSKISSIDDVLKKAAENNVDPYQDIEAALENLEKSHKEEPKRTSFQDMADGVSGIFNTAKDAVNKAKDTADTFIQEQETNFSNGVEVAKRLEAIAEELVDSNGKISKFTLKSLVEELANIANEIQGNDKNPKKNNGMGNSMGK